MCIRSYHVCFISSPRGFLPRWEYGHPPQYELCLARFADPGCNYLVWLMVFQYSLCFSDLPDSLTREHGVAASLLAFSSAAQSRLTLCDTMDRSTPGPPVNHQLPDVTQTHVHRVGDAIQPSHPQSSPSPPAFNLSQHQGLFKCCFCKWLLLVVSTLT